MGQTKSMNKVDLNQHRESKYTNNQYNFKNVFEIKLILNQIFQFMEKDDIKVLSLGAKKIYRLYCEQVKKLKKKKILKNQIYQILSLINIKI